MQLMLKIFSAEKSINNTYDALLKVIQSQRIDLLEKLITFKTERLKAMQTRADECARQSVIMDSFKRYIEELIAHGSACDIARSTNDLLARAGELITSQEDFNVMIGKQVKDRVDFTPANIPDITSGWTQLIGGLCFNGECYSIRVSVLRKTQSFKNIILKFIVLY